MRSVDVEEKMMKINRIDSNQLKRMPIELRNLVSWGQVHSALAAAVAGSSTR